MQLLLKKFVYKYVGNCRYSCMQNNVGLNNIEALRRRRQLSALEQPVTAPFNIPIQQNPERIWASLDVLSSMNRPFLGSYTVKMSNSNGFIGDFKQGAVGDCWLLSGLKSLAVTPIGTDIIKNAITKNEDGTVTVKFKGANKSYTITEEEFNKAANETITSPDGVQEKKYATGDADVLLFEIAMKKLKNEIAEGKTGADLPNYAKILVNKEAPIEGGAGAQLYYLLTGKEACGISATGAKNPQTGEVLFKDNKEKLTEFLEKYSLDNKKYAASFGVDKEISVKTLTGKDCRFVPHHEYALEGTFGGNIIISNPCDSARKIVIPQSEFLNMGVSLLTYQNLKDDNDPIDKELTKYLEMRVRADNYINKHF